MLQRRRPRAAVVVAWSILLAALGGVMMFYSYPFTRRLAVVRSSMSLKSAQRRTLQGIRLAMRMLEDTEDFDVVPCVPHMAVSFVKIQESGSGSMHNVLASAAARHGVPAALPNCPSCPNCYNLFPGSPSEDRLRLNRSLLAPSTPRYSMFFDHAILNTTDQLEYMPPDTAFITQLREPSSHVWSQIGKFHHGPGAPDLEKFLAAPVRGNTQCYPTKNRCYRRNLAACYLGYSHPKYPEVTPQGHPSVAYPAADDTQFMGFFQQLVRKLSLVLIMERKEESMLLLKRRLCWPIQDVLYIQTHRIRRNMSSLKTADLKTLHRRLSSLDYYVYEYYSAQLDRQVSTAGENFQEELLEYIALQKQFSELCQQLCRDLHAEVTQNTTAKKVLAIRRILQKQVPVPSTQYNAAFSLTYEQCVWAMAPEYVVKVMLKLRQHPVACKSPSFAATLGLSSRDCDVNSHVMPGYHVDVFTSFFLNQQKCLNNDYNDL